MINFRSMTAVLALGAALAVPGLAQTATNAGMNNGAATNGTATTAPAMTSPVATTPAMGGAAANGRPSTYTTADNDVRASKVIGASVYDDHDQKIGTVDELLMNANHDVTKAVLSVGGFLGIDSKLVAVDIDKLQVRPDRIVMSGATKDALNGMPTYKFSNSAS
jgi:sporulation protein YlmC with PRC-barrel domain